ncbi:hypothetical protein ABZZ74_47945, partial [Streptomyces sp. NPDC006476]
MLAVPVDLLLSGPPGKARQPKVDKAGDLLHYAVVRDRWERRSCGEGAKGQRFYDWTAFEATVTGQELAPGFAHWLLVRRSTEKKLLAGGRIDYEYAFFLGHAPTGTPVPQMISRAGVRWQIEVDNREAKQPVGLGGYQVRTWTAWHRHVTCAMLALAFLVGRGSSTEYNCGQVLDLNASYFSSTNNAQISGVVKTSLCAIPGDSGAPVTVPNGSGVLG